MRPGVTAFLGLVCCACATSHTVSLGTGGGECVDILKRGIFNHETMACFPQIAAAVEERLCEAGFRTHNEANFAGFGYGSPIFGQILLPPEQARYGLGSARVAAWKVEHCHETANRKALSWPAAVAWWGDLYDRLPISLVGPWRSCRESMSETMSRERGLLCYLYGSYDLSGEDEEIRFTAWNWPDAWLDLGARLHSDLEVEGADCGGEEWRAGSRIPSGSSRVLVCRRRGRTAVRVRLVTGEGTCERRLPELTEPPWQELCQSKSSSILETGTPGATTSSVSVGKPVEGTARNR